MNSKKAIYGLLIAVGATALLTTGVMAQEDPGNIVEIAQETDDLSTLVTAVVAADLVDALSDENAELTVFAPTNAAFDELPDGTLEDLLEEENIDQLSNILTYHVVDGEVLSGDLSDGQVVTALNGQELTVRIDGENVFINDAQVTTADVQASNGVVHIIDGVLLPEATGDGAHSTADTGIELPFASFGLILLALVGLSGGAVLAYELNRK